MKTRREEELTVPNRARLDCQSHSRRVFLKTVLTAIAGSSPGSWRGDKTLLVEAAELSREFVTVDLHCHPNALTGAHFPGVDPNIREHMQTGGLDAGLFAARGDYPVIRRDAAG